MSRLERVLDRITDGIIERPLPIVVGCLVLTLLFLPGMALLDSEAGSDQFAEDVPESDALEAVNEEFEPAFDPNEPTTQLIQQDTNVLDRNGLLSMLEAIEQLEERDSLRVSGVNTPASAVANELDPEAATTEQQREAIERATDEEIEAAVERAGEDPGFGTLLADDFNAETGEASASLNVVTHEFPDDTDLTPVQRETETVLEGSDTDITVFGAGILDDEFASVIFDSLAIVVPAALVTILGLLAYAYRDPIDFTLGGVALLMTVVWTFGFTGYVGIPFSDMLIAVPVLLLAIGIDFGIHTVNRYREERIEGIEPEPAMRTALGQLSVAYAIIAGTTVIGFLANLTSSLEPIREFGIVAGVGILFTLVIFVGFLPAVKLVADRWRARYGVPTFGTAPLGSEESALGRSLPALTIPSRPSPAVFVVLVLVLTGGAAVYGAGVDTTFDDEDFLPPAEEPGYVSALPESLQPGEYTVTETIDLLEETFETGEDDTVTVYVETRMTDDTTLRMLERAENDPPDTFIQENGSARTDSIQDPVDGLAEEDPKFAALVDDAALDGGPPNRDLDRIYEQLEASGFERFTAEYLTDERRSTRVVYEVESGASDEAITEDARDVADRYRGDAIATGEIILFQSVADTIFESATRSLVAALGLASVFLVILFGTFLGRPSIGVIALVPVAVAIATLTALMRWFGIPFNALTTTILSITIGLGLDYSVHVAHRFHDEYEETGDVDRSIGRTLRGTGGALTGTMATTVLGTGVLILAITPLLGQFGLLTAASIFLAYIAALVVLPPVLLCWVAVTDRRYDLLAVGRLLGR